MLYEFRNQTETSEDLYIYGDIVSENVPDWEGNIDENAVDLKMFKEKMEGLGAGKTLNIYINSGGGSVFAASAMISMIKRAQDKGARVIAYVDGIAASAASFFTMAANETHLYRNSMIMIHKPMSFMFGYYNAAELSKIIGALDALEKGVLMSLYMSRAKISEQRIRNMVAAETWMNADQIVETFDGFVLHEEAKNIAACASKYFDRYLNTPDAVAASTAKKPVNLSDYRERLEKMS